MRIPFASQLTQAIGLDLGSSRTRIWTTRDGLVLDEPTCLAVDDRTNKVVAVGQEAIEMQGRVSSSVSLYHAVQKGRLHDLDVARALLRVFLQRVMKSGSFFRPAMMVSLPAASTEIDQVAMTELLYSVGAREVYTISQPLAAAIGAGVPVADTSGSFILQVGSGLAEAGIISLASLVNSESYYQAGAAADLRIRNRVRDEAGLDISLEAAERLKQRIGSLITSVDKEQLVTGQDLIESSPKEVKISSAQIRPPLLKLATQYEMMVKKLFAQIPPELTTDVIDKGMLLSGGFSQLQGLDVFLVNHLGIPVTVVEEPDLAVIKGIGTALEHIDLFKESLGYRT